MLYLLALKVSLLCVHRPTYHYIIALESLFNQSTRFDPNHRCATRSASSSSAATTSRGAPRGSSASKRSASQSWASLPTTASSWPLSACPSALWSRPPTAASLLHTAVSGMTRASGPAGIAIPIRVASPHLFGFFLIRQPFLCHSGISPEIRTLAEIEALDRFVEPDCKGALCDILWFVHARLLPAPVPRPDVFVPLCPLHPSKTLATTHPLTTLAPPHRSDPLHEHELEPTVMARPHTLTLGQEEKGEGGASSSSGTDEEDVLAEFLRVEFRPNWERGCSYYFGFRAIRRFLDDNGLLCLVRAHQVQEEGYRRHFDPLRLNAQRRRRAGASSSSSSSSSTSSSSPPLTHSNVQELLPPVITIFSAPHYAGRYGNKVRRGAGPHLTTLTHTHAHQHATPRRTTPRQAAFLRVGLQPEEMSFEQFDCVPAPHLPPKLPWAELAMSSGIWGLGEDDKDHSCLLRDTTAHSTAQHPPSPKHT
jgi:diadenosine tetraphosphatase ApaH/serine/threonine PP2A family protein phosphatase